MKNGELVNHLAAIENVKNLKLGGKLSLVLAKNKKKLIDAYKTLEEVRIKLCEESCEKDEKGEYKKENNSYVFLPENQKKVDADFVEVLEQDSDVRIEKINIGTLEQFSDITVGQIEALMLFAEE